MRTRWLGGLGLLSIVISACGTPSATAPTPHGGVAAITSLATPSSPQPAGSTNIYASTMQGLDPRVKDIPERVYCPASDAGVVTEIDPSTFQVITRFRAGQIPHHIAPSPDLSTLYVDEEKSGTLLKLNPTTGKPEGTVGVNDPYNLYFTPDGTTAIVVEEAFHKLAFYNPNTWQLIRKVPVAVPGIDHLDFSADGSYFFISAEFSGIVLKFDSHTGQELGMVNVGGLPIDVRLSPDGSLFYVANQGRSGVSVVDPSSMKEIQFIPTAKGAHGLYVSRDTTKLYVTNRLAGSVSVIDFATRQVVATWHVGGYPDMIQLNPDGTQMWASSRYDGNVLVIDTQTGQLLHKISCGAGAHGLTYFPAPGRISLGHNGVYR